MQEEIPGIVMRGAGMGSLVRPLTMGVNKSAGGQWCTGVNRGLS